MAQRADRDSHCLYRSLAEDSPSRTVAVVSRLHGYHSPTAERFLAGLREELNRGS